LKDLGRFSLDNIAMSSKLLIAGGGIGGLAAALACSQVGAQVQVLEQTEVLAEVGAGIQLGPNVVKILEGWGLGSKLRQVASFPARLEVRHAMSAAVLGVLPLGPDMIERYGAAYASIARSDLHNMLLTAVQAAGVPVQLGTQVTGVTQLDQSVQVQVVQGGQSHTLHAPLLVGADGLWSAVRRLVLNDGKPRVTGHLAYRAMVMQSALPPACRSQVVTAWMGPHFHVVQYPVRGGEWLNVVAIVHGAAPANLQHWDHHANAPELRALLAHACGPLLDLFHAIDDWRLWALCDRPPMQSAAEQVRGRVALLGDAAHPMPPYLAQGAAMAIEDAAVMAQELAVPGVSAVLAVQQYAQRRWQRNARVQARSIRNGKIFHAKGITRMGRDMSLRLLGAKLLDVPWLYRGLQ
jgi:salicylate hydroxylase